jgi:hypothetical protein
MPENVYFRDPRHPDEVHGPFTVLELKKCALRGELRPTYQVSVDRKAWMGADEFEPELFDGESSDRGDTSRDGQEGRQGFSFSKIEAWPTGNSPGRPRSLLGESPDAVAASTDYAPFSASRATREIRLRDDNHRGLVRR